MSRQSETDPFALLMNRDDAGLPEHMDVLQEAVDRFDPENPSSLLLLLAADDDLVRQRGLFIFGEIGEKGFVALDYALKSIGHPSESARASLMDGIISYPRKLKSDQVCKILGLADDAGVLVREKIITFLGVVSLEVLHAAIALLNEPDRYLHSEGIQYLVEKSDDVQGLFDRAISNSSTRSTYALASIERMARDGIVTTPPAYQGDDYIACAVVEHVKRLAALRRRTP